jgi:hypothetical protein
LGGVDLELGRKMLTNPGQYLGAFHGRR